MVGSGMGGRNLNRDKHSPFRFLKYFLLVEIELIQAQNFRLPPTLKRAGMGAEIIIIRQIKPKGFRRNAQKDCPMTVY